MENVVINLTKEEIEKLERLTGMAIWDNTDLQIAIKTILDNL